MEKSPIRKPSIPDRKMERRIDGVYLRNNKPKSHIPPTLAKRKSSEEIPKISPARKERQRKRKSLREVIIAGIYILFPLRRTIPNIAIMTPISAPI